MQQTAETLMLFVLIHSFVCRALLLAHAHVLLDIAGRFLASPKPLKREQANAAMRMLVGDMCT